jgi:hypothetical protein
MRLLLTLFMITIGSLNANDQQVEILKMNHFAQESLDQGLNIPEDTLKIAITYQGGCKNDHEFKLTSVSCQEDSTGTPHCRMSVEHRTQDPCKAYMLKTVHFPLNQYLPKHSFTLTLEDSRGQTLTTYVKR